MAFTSILELEEAAVAETSQDIECQFLPALPLEAVGSNTISAQDPTELGLERETVGEIALFGNPIKALDAEEY